VKTIAKALIPALGLLSIVHFGCRTLSTSKNNLPSESAINGMLYYLPIGKITIKGEFKSEASQTSKLRLATSGTSSARRKPSDGDGSSEGGTAISGGALTITLTSEVEPDESTGEYYVIPHANYIYEDETRVKVNAKHLLSTGNVTSEDKTAEIVGTLASMAAEIPKGVTKVTPTPTPTPSPPFYFSFHPSNSTEYDHVKKALANRKIRLKVTYPGQQTQTGGKEILLSRAVAEQIGEEGLIFRPGIPYKVTLRYPDETNFNESETLIDTTQQFILPDTNRLYEMKYNRMAFVKKVKEIGFTDGMLTEFYQKVPSPILGFLGIPKAILQAIVPIPAASPSGSGSSSGTTSAQ
jgi:hypothetical protein